MKNWMSLTLLIAAIALASSCEEQTPGGKIPAKYAKNASQFVGTYYGGMEGGPKGNLIISISKTNVVSARFTGGDILGKNCGSRLGLLKKIEGSNGVLTKVVFDLPNNCYEGKTLELSTNSAVKGFWAAWIVSSSDYVESCPSESEIRSCEDKVREDDWNRFRNGDEERFVDGNGFECDRRSDPFHNGDCRSESSWDSQNCSACSTRKTQDFVSGSFSR